MDSIFIPYSKISDIVQIKFKTLDKALIYQKKTIQRIEEIYNGEIIIHLKTKDIYDNEISNELEWFTNNTNNNCKFLIHLKDDFPIDRIYDLSKILKFNQMLLLENDKSIKNKKDYIKKLDMFFNKNDSLNVKACLDFGHLLFNEDHESQEDILNYILKNKNLTENIILFHLHDFNDIKDHLNISTGNLNYSAVGKLLYLKNNIPIILEVTLKSIEEHCSKEIEKLYLKIY